MKRLSFYNWYVIVLTALAVLPILAPFLLKLSESITFLQLPANLIYLVYSFTCHQFASRSLHAFDYQFAWCARDTGIWLGMLLPALFANKIRSVKWYWLPVFVAPIALDGVIQTVATVLGVNPTGMSGEPLYISTNLIRFLTGAWFGIGVSLWVSPFLREAVEVKQKTKNIKQKNIHWVLILFSLSVAFYLSAVFVWNATSPKYKPTDFLDSAVKTPANEFYLRRENGPCTANIEDLVRVECLLKIKN